ncbi:methyltransferase domain-containing protein [Planctomicrobium sp. SH664]|uniref:class I SAM-dependent methyltransferase n=1 Tax=Planctomicrobium sp. SH664 TaxID=3448125 RepID=UPI003F5C8485
MSWKLKAHTLAVLSRMPAGSRLYHWLQRAAGTNRLQTSRDLGRAFELVELIHDSGKSIDGAFCLEIGTGWRPFVPYVLALAGAQRVITVDVNPWLTLNYAKETWRALEPELAEIAVRCHCSEEEVLARYRRADLHAKSLSEFLKPLRIEYLYPADARQTGLPEASVDIVVSSNVLEHIPRDIQGDIHRESHRILKVGGVVAHRFNPQDHYSTVDAQITNGNFLRYSSQEWHWYGGSGLAYHNRLRSRDYRELFEAAGFQLGTCRERVDSRTVKAIRSGQLPVHQEFNRYTIDELAVDYMWVACLKQRAALPKADVAQQRVAPASAGHR